MTWSLGSFTQKGNLQLPHKGLTSTENPVVTRIHENVLPSDPLLLGLAETGTMFCFYGSSSADGSIKTEDMT